MNTDKIRMRTFSAHNWDRPPMVGTPIPLRGMVFRVLREGAVDWPDVPIYPTYGQKNPPSVIICVHLRLSVANIAVGSSCFGMPTE